MKSATRITSALLVTAVLAAAVAGLGYLTWRRALHESGEMYHQANSLYETKQYPQAEELFAALLERRSAEEYAGEARYKLARLLTIQKRYGEAAEKWADVAREPGPAAPDEVAYYQGLCAEQLGDAAAAKAYYNQVRNAGGTAFADDAALRLGMLAEAQEDPDAARLYFEDVVRGSDDRDTILQAGEALRRINLALFKRGGDDTAVTHRVRSGENLQSIAQQYNSTVDLIMEVNGISDPSRLRKDQRLRIPQTDFSIVIDKGNFLLTLYNGDRIFAVYPVGLGKNGCTPVGTFSITNKIKDPTWWSPNGPIPPGDPENELGSRWMGLKPEDPSIGNDYGIHATIKPDTIGTEASNGCPRMYEADAEELFRLVGVGTPVRIDAA